MDLTRTTKNVVDLVNLVNRLRGPGGCPWDAQQSDASIKMYLLEEAFEVLEAVERKTPPEVCGELGDLLFQILFLTRLAEERGEFDFADVMERITQKMIRRHPHVFGDAQVEDPKEVARNWAKIKKEEQAGREGGSSAIQNIPASLPALLRAHRILERSRTERQGGKTSDEVWPEVEEAFHSLRKEYESGRDERVGDAVGRLLFAITDFAREQGSNAEELLRMANQRYLKAIPSRNEAAGGADGNGRDHGAKPQKEP